jgi:hypothetical protein
MEQTKKSEWTTLRCKFWIRCSQQKCGHMNKSFPACSLLVAAVKVLDADHANSPAVEAT